VLELSEKEQLQQLVNTWWFKKGECGNDRTSKKVRFSVAAWLQNIIVIIAIVIIIIVIIRHTL